MRNYILSGKLHTEILEETYGKTSVYLLQDDDSIREVLLLDQQQIARTYAITLKNNTWKDNSDIIEVNETIKKGGAIGKTFAAAGYEIQKNVLAVYLVRTPLWLRFAFDSNLHWSKARVTEFIVKKDDTIFNYATITEVYAPDFRKPEITETDEKQISISADVLSNFGCSNKEIWTALQKGAMPHRTAKYHPDIVKEVKEKVQEIMAQSIPIASFC